MACVGGGNANPRGFQALDSALETALQLALSVPLVDVNAFPKLCKAYFIFFEILFRNHIGAVVALDTPVFMRVMHSLHDGLQVCVRVCIYFWMSWPGWTEVVERYIFSVFIDIC